MLKNYRTKTAAPIAFIAIGQNGMGGKPGRIMYLESSQRWTFNAESAKHWDTETKARAALATVTKPKKASLKKLPFEAVVNACIFPIMSDDTLTVAEKAQAVIDGDA